MRPAAGLAARLGLPVGDLDLLEQALVHSSYLHEHPEAVVAHNERLEFLGDSVVNLAVSEALYARHPGDDEGTLSARRAAIVSAAGLARIAGRIDLGAWLLLGEGEAARSGRGRPSLLASSLEAVVGALYLDLGWSATRDWLIELASPELAADLPMGTLKSPKSQLQELTQRRGGRRPVYRIVQATGPDHAKLFRIEVLVNDQVVGVGEGYSRRVAETAAAEAAMAALGGSREDTPDGAAASPLDGPAEGGGVARADPGAGILDPDGKTTTGTALAPMPPRARSRTAR
jgi:ribonuclease-3